MFPEGQWVEFEETVTHGLCQQIDYYGDMMPFQNASIEEVLVVQKMVDLSYGDHFYVDDAGEVQALTHGWRVYYNVEPDVAEVGATLEEAVDKLRIHLFATRPTCYDWRVISGDEYIKLLLER